ncbi:hypothetical protein [Streptomyces sp. NPDC056255]|uniref:hypothetical protein n=1 Tax=Streptomyces sp. NPDC056255 TaxID=3345764 RepID=UPI0035D9B75F
MARALLSRVGATVPVAPGGDGLLLGRIDSVRGSPERIDAATIALRARRSRTAALASPFRLGR